MSNISRHHHYLPQFYLAGFTKSGEKNGRLFVLDQEQIKQWPSSPTQSAHQRDFYALDPTPDVNPAVFEEVLARVEGECSPVIRGIISKKALPSGKEFNVFLNFVALMAVRVPTIRNAESDFINQVFKDMLKMELSSPEGWEAMQKAAKEDGQKVPSSYDELKKLIESDDFTINLQQNWHLPTLVDSVGTLLPLLAKRKWSIWTARDTAPDLICSDCPVSLTWAADASGPWSPGFGLPNTILSFPISRRMAVIVSFEGQSDKCMNDFDIACVNLMTRLSGKKLFSSEEDFIWLTKENSIGYASDLLSALKNQPEK